MLDMLLKSIGYSPERLQNELAEFKAMAQTVRDVAVRTDERLARIEAALDISTEPKEIEHG